MSSTTEKYLVKINGLTIRAIPLATSNILGRLTRDEIIEKLEESPDGNWIRIIHDGVEGWSFKRYLKKIPNEPIPTEEFPWMLIAEKEKGVSEVPGSGNNPRVVEYLNATTNLSASVKSKDETPWCSAFVNWCMQQAGIEGTKNALARSWQQWGEHIDQPYKGCVVVFQREKKFGHVGFYLEETETHIKVLSGNQQNPETKIFEVSEKYYPKTDFLEYRSLGKQ